MDLAELEFSDELLDNAIKGAPGNSTCDDHAQRFATLSHPMSEIASAAKFLSVACSWRLRPDDPDAPFENTWNAPSLADVSAPQLAALAKIGREVTEPELRARLCDIIWIRTRKHEFARVASSSYMDAALGLLQIGRNIGVRERLLRALQLAGKLGTSGPLLPEIVSRIRSLAEKPSTDRCTVADCMRVLLAQRRGDAVAFHRLCVRHAEQIKSNSPNPLWERGFWDLGAEFAKNAKDADGQRAAQLASAATFEREADRAPMHVIAVGFLEQALQAYRKIKGAKEHCTRVHRKLLESQAEVHDELVPLASDPIDITDLVTQSRSRVRGREKPRALAELVFASRCPSVQKLKEQSQSRIKDFPLAHLFQTVRYGSTWKVSAQSPGSAANGDEINEERLHAEMCQEYKFTVGIAARGSIEPMRQQVLSEHCVAIEDIYSLVAHSHIIPADREGLLAIGIHAGLHGRFVESLHVLVPQIEHILRTSLSYNGVSCSGIDKDGIQQEFNLNQLAIMPETEALVGKDMCFALRVLFVDRHGYNLRNEMAHGMVSTGAFFSDLAIYVWWFIFRFVAGPVARAVIDGYSKAESASRSPESETK